MKVSVVIPTFNRVGDLELCLESVEKQAYAPDEVIVIDNSSNSDADDLINRVQGNFNEIGCKLGYFRNSRNSLTIARNLGARLSSGDIIIFLDDDVIIDPDYIGEIRNIYESNPNALGVQGYIDPGERRVFHDLLYQLFFWYHPEIGKCRVLPSVSTTYPQGLNKVMSCQWLSGANHSYRRSVLTEFQYDERLMKYSDGEDLDFSYRVYRKYPGTLFITPFARLAHNTSMTSRTLGKELIFMQEIYGLYLFYKLFDHTINNTMIYVWSRFGRIIISLLRAVFRRHPGALLELKHLVKAYILSYKRIDEIKLGKLDFFNKTLS